MMSHVRSSLISVTRCLACLLCLAVLSAPAPAAGQQQPSTTGSGSQAGGGKAPAKAGAGGSGAAASRPAAGAKTPAPSKATGQAGSTAQGAARTSGAAGSKGSPAGTAAPGTPAIGAPLPDTGNIDQILEGDEEVLAGNAFSYDPGNRRDPFKSLLIAPDRPEFRGPRPEGIPGLLIDEIDLKGVFRTARGYVAQVIAANQKKSFLLKEGDQLYDGDVVSIGKNEVVFKQIVQDPTALKPFREVVKSLNPGG
jgi:hypothetical protein